MADILTRLRDRINDSHMDAEHLMDDAADEIERLRAALKPFAEIGERLHAANQRSDQSVLIGASARFLKLEPLTGRDFVNAHLAHEQRGREGKSD